jgi:hypothetical protein
MHGRYSVSTFFEFERELEFERFLGDVFDSLQGFEFFHLLSNFENLAKFYF